MQVRQDGKARSSPVRTSKLVGQRSRRSRQISKFPATLVFPDNQEMLLLPHKEEILYPFSSRDGLFNCFLELKPNTRRSCASELGIPVLSMTIAVLRACPQMRRNDVCPENSSFPCWCSIHALEYYLGKFCMSVL